MDEREIIHRLKSTRFAVLVGIAIMFVYFQYELIVKHVIHWDIFYILLAMALAKVAAIIYYRKMN